MSQIFHHIEKLRVYVIEPVSALRYQIVEALKNIGCTGVTGYSDLKSFLDLVEQEPVDWIISATFSTSEVNILQILHIFVEEPRLKHARISCIFRDSEQHLLPDMFELGMFSAHSVNVSAKISEEFQALLRNLRHTKYNSTLTSAIYVRKILRSFKAWKAIIKLEKTLLELFPGYCDILFSLAETQLISGREEGYQTLQQILLIYPNLSDQVEQISSQYKNTSMFAGELIDENADAIDTNFNALGIQSAILIDPDEAVQNAIRQMISTTGVPCLEVFDSGESAWEFLKHGTQPGLIFMEWRVPEVSGIQLLQRIRQKYVSVPIVVVSSLISQSEIPLLKEMGVNAVVEKPFDTTTLIVEVVSALQKHKYPTEQSSMDRKIQNCLQLNNKKEASRLLVAYLVNPQYDEIGKKRIEAEFAFFEGHYHQCCTIATDALKHSSNSLELLNLLGKSLMKLGDFETALKCLQKANDLVPRNIDRLCKMATLCSNLGKIEEAEAHLGQAVSIDAQNILVLETEAEIALQNKDGVRAAKALESLDSLHRIVGFINNKAVALVRNNQFHDGIALYKSALEAFPKPWNSIHDIVSYNLALAYVRFHEYNDAMTTLNLTMSSEEENLGKKIAALKSKIKNAQLSNASVVLSSDIKISEEIHLEKDDGHNKNQSDFTNMIDSLVASRGDLCCYRIFFVESLSSPEVSNMLKNCPKLKKRPPSER